MWTAFHAILFLFPTWALQPIFKLYRLLITTWVMSFDLLSRFLYNLTAGCWEESKISVFINLTAQCFMALPDWIIIFVRWFFLLDLLNRFYHDILILLQILTRYLLHLQGPYPQFKMFVSQVQLFGQKLVFSHEILLNCLIGLFLRFSSFTDKF